MAWRALSCVAAVLLLVSGCGGGEGAGGGHMSPGQMETRINGRGAHRAMMRQRARMQYRAMMRQRAHHRTMMARRRQRRMIAKHRAEVRQLRAEEAERRAEQAAPEEEASECDPNYTGACLDPSASDYDCAGGSGDGPQYTGPVTVVGEDHYGLDADSDGTGCEP
jgi:hypothetical protein